MKAFLLSAALIALAVMLLGACAKQMQIEHTDISEGPIKTNVETAAPKTVTPVPTPIATTEPEPSSIIAVRGGDMLSRDILPQLAIVFDISEEQAKAILGECPESFLISDSLSDFRRMEGMIPTGEYRVYAEDTLEEFIGRWISETENLYQTVISDITEQNELKPYERLILASVIELECVAKEYQHETAAVFLNRLKKGMKLQSCATTEYAIGFQRPYLLTADTKTESPYNTYHIKGLPKGPICAPDKESLKAACGVSTDKDILFFFYSYADDEMHFFSDYEAFKIKGRASREQFEKTFEMSPHTVLDKRDHFGLN